MVPVYKKWLPVSGFLIFTTITSLLFQNCSGMKFSTASSVVAVGEEIPAGVTGSGKTELILPPVDNTPKPLEFVLLIDVSYSNKSNALSLLNGLKSFVANLPDNALSLEVHYVGTTDSLIGSRPEIVEQFSETRKRTTSESFIKEGAVKISKGAGQTKEEFTSALNVEIEKVITYLNSTTAGEIDTYPKIQEIIALMSKRQNLGTSQRTVYVYATDEDVLQNYNGPISRKYVMEQIRVANAPATTYYYAPGTCTYPAEGGGVRTDNCEVMGCPTCYPKIESCGDVQGINAAIAARGNMTANAQTFSGCRSQSIGGGFGWQTVNDSQVRTDWLGREYLGSQASLKIPKVAEQILELSRLPNQPQFFFGLFSVREGDIKNADQEIAVNIQNFVKAITPLGNMYSSSINSTDYTPFLQAVQEFKIKTENNRVSLQKVYDSIPSGYKIQVRKLEIFDDKTNAWLETSQFQVNGAELVLYDRRFDFQTGAKIKLDYLY